MCFSTQASAAEVYVVNDQELSLENEVFSSGVLTQADLAVKTDVRFGTNTMQGVPKGTHFKLIQNQEGENYVSLAIFGAEFQNQKWKMGNVGLVLNCSPHENKDGMTRARVVSFYSNMQINGRCKAVNEASIKTPDGGLVTLAVGSELFFTESGLLKSATKIKTGYIFLGKQKISLRTGSFLDYDSLGNIHFFYLPPGTAITLSTDISSSTVFKQFEYEQPQPILFYPNGNVESGRVVLTEDMTVSPFILGDNYDLEALDGPMGFDENGRLDRFILKTELTLTMKKDSKIFFIDAINRGALPLTLKKGETIPIPAGSHLYLGYEQDRLVLNGFPLQINGESYFLSFRKP